MTLYHYNGLYEAEQHADIWEDAVIVGDRFVGEFRKYMKELILVNAIMIAASFSAISQSQSQGQAPVVISVDSIHIAYEVHGEGMPALVFVHGWSCDRSYWKWQLQPFSRLFKVVPSIWRGMANRVADVRRGRWVRSAETSRPLWRSSASNASFL